MRLDEAITISSVERFMQHRRASLITGTAVGVTAVTMGASLPMAVLAGAISAYSVKFIDRYLNGEASTKRLHKMEVYIEKRRILIDQYRKYGNNNQQYFHAISRALRIIKSDIDAHANIMKKAAINGLKRDNLSDEQEITLNNIIKTMDEVLKTNTRPLTEGIKSTQINEVAVIIPILLVAAAYARDRWYKDIKRKQILKKIEDNEDVPFSEVEPHIWSYLREMAIQYYRGFVTAKEMEDQVKLVMFMVTHKDVSPMINKK